MNLFKKKTEPQSPQQRSQLPLGLGHEHAQLPSGLGRHGQRINYTWIVKHFGFLLFLALLGVIYIANGHWADNTIRDINITQKKVKDMEYEYKNLKSLEMYRSRESQVVEAAAALGLKPAATPPVKLEMPHTKTANN